jgi:hypothetical protein
MKPILAATVLLLAAIAQAKEPRPHLTMDDHKNTICGVAFSRTASSLPPARRTTPSTSTR